MPGRICLYDDLEFKTHVSKVFGTFRDDVGVLEKHYNIPPTLDIPIYTNKKHYTYAHFGLIPSWAKGRSSMQINARSESVFEKSSFKEAYKHRRCLIPLSGYYEWVKDPQTKQSSAHFIHAANETYFVFAGIYETWYDNALKKPILTCALLTTEPNEKIAAIHERMPVILEPKSWKTYLDENSSYGELNALYKPIEDEKVDFYPVGDAVNSVKNDTAECIEALTEMPPRQATLF